MQRWHEDVNRTRREWAEHRRFHLEESAFGIVECPCQEQMGRFRKRRAYGCGKPRCLLCHSDKFPKRELTRQERIAELRFTEQLHEFCEGE